MERVLKSDEDIRDILKRALEQSHVAFVITDEKTNIQYVNRAFCDLTGYSIDEVIGKNPKILQSGIHSKEFYEAMWKQLAETGTWVGEFCNKKKSGEIFWEKVVISSVKDFNGKTTHYISTKENITEKKIAEKKLNQYGIVLSNTTDMVALINDKYEYLMINNSFAETIGKSADEIVGRTMPEIFGEKNFNEVIKQKVDLCLSGQKVNYQRWVEFGGKRKCIDITYSPLIEKNGVEHVTGVISVARDTTYRKEIEESIREISERAQKCLDVALIMFIIIGKDGTVSLINQKTSEILGYSEDEIVGKNWFENFIPEHNRKNTLSVWNSIMDSQIDFPEYYENTILTRDGRERLIAWNNTPLFDKTGHVIGILSSGQDITDSRLALEKLSESEKRYRGLIDSITSMIVRVDMNHNFTFVNDTYCKKFGKTREELIGNTYKNLVHPDDIDMTLKEMEKMKDPPHRIRIKQRAMTVDGYRWTEWENCYIFDDNGKPIEIQAVGKDIHEEKILASKIIKSNKELDQFAHVISHDLKEPLRTISGFSYLLKKNWKALDISKIEEYMDRLSSGAERMSDMIDGLLLYSKCTKDEGEFDIFDIRSIIDEVLQDLYFQIKVSDAEISVNVSEKVYCSRIQMMHVFQNIISNAIKFYKDKPKVVIDCLNLLEFWQFSIRDNGIGIPQKEFGKIFKIFERGSSARNIKGTGIGLAICKKIVEKHGGEIWFESKDGEGTTFFFTISKNLEKMRDEWL